jgi:hypothetical protein
MKEKSIARGRNLVIAIAAFFMLLELLVIAWQLFLEVQIPLSTISRVVITVVLLVLMYKGYEWAKLVLSLGAFVGICVSLLFLYVAITRPLALISVVVALIGILSSSSIVIILLFSASIWEFMKSQNELRQRKNRQ